MKSLFPPRNGKTVELVLGFVFLALTIFCLVSCQPKVDTAPKKLELEELKAEETLLRIEAETLSAETASLTAKTSDRVRIKKRQRYAEEDLQLFDDYIAELNSAVAFYEKEVAMWREAHRKSLIGYKTSSLLTANGRELPNVTIHQLRDDELIFDSNGQEIRLKLSELSEESKTRFVDEESLRLSKKRQPPE